MKNSNKISKASSLLIRKTNYSKFASVFGLVLLSSGILNAQNTSPVTESSISGLTYLMIIIGIVVVASGYSVFAAKRILEQNGKELKFSFLSFRWMATHGKAVAVIVGIIILTAICWALNY